MSTDDQLNIVAQKLRQLDPNGERISKVLRKTIDQLYDGQHTGRYRWDQLHKTEKTHCGTLVEINLHREFKFDDGEKMDYCIEGIDVDCKYSQDMYKWMIPPEAMDHLCILLSADDEKSIWSLGFARIKEEILTGGEGNRDGKRTISAGGRASIHWVFKDAALPPNILLQLDRETVERIMRMPDGQKRINEIFRVAQGERIGRGVIATLGQQDDYMKRVRENGGARTRLKKEGIIILGDYAEHREIARGLGVAVPDAGESISVRVSESGEATSGTVLLEGKYWKVAEESDPVAPAPSCPHSQKKPSQGKKKRTRKKG